MFLKIYSLENSPFV